MAADECFESQLCRGLDVAEWAICVCGCELLRFDEGSLKAHFRGVRRSETRKCAFGASENGLGHLDDVFPGEAELLEALLA